MFHATTKTQVARADAAHVPQLHQAATTRTQVLRQADPLHEPQSLQPAPTRNQGARQSVGVPELQTLQHATQPTQVGNAYAPAAQLTAADARERAATSRTAAPTQASAASAVRAAPAATAPAEASAASAVRAAPAATKRLEKKETRVTIREIIDDEEATPEQVQDAAAAVIQAKVRGAIARKNVRTLKKKATAINLYIASRKAKGDNFAVLDKDGSKAVTLDEWREAFCMMDQNGDGILTRKEWELLQEDVTVFDAFPRKYFAQIAKKEWDDAFMALDRDKSGRISVDEWSRAKLGTAPKPDKVLAKHGPLEFMPPQVTPNRTLQARVDHALQSANLEEMLAIFYDCHTAARDTFPTERRKVDKLHTRIIYFVQRRVRQCIKDDDMDGLRALVDALDRDEAYLRLSKLAEVKEAKAALRK